MTKSHLTAILAVLLGVTACSADEKKQGTPTVSTPSKEKSSASGKSGTATFAGGCFWCTEGVFERVPGVLDVVSGYTGGTDPHPTYEKVCSPTMKVSPDNHAEAIQITYDPEETWYKKLLAYFWKAHDPTTLNRQGNDAGSQYRSAIFYHNDEQRALAEESKKLLNDSDAYGKPVVTQIVAASEFHEAEGYHQDYFEKNPGDGYCNFVLVPKLDKIFQDWRSE